MISVSIGKGQRVLPEDLLPHRDQNLIIAALALYFMGARLCTEVNKKFLK